MVICKFVRRDFPGDGGDGPTRVRASRARIPYLDLTITQDEKRVVAAFPFVRSEELKKERDNGGFSSIACNVRGGGG